jgi:energy-coupling factor transporter transmembrane protein EcfT
MSERSERPRRQSQRTIADLHLLRYVPVASPVHRMWAGTKLIVVTVFSIATLQWPGWASLGVVAAVLALGLLVSRVPFGAVPRPPRWFAIGLAMSAAFSLESGVHGLTEWLRFITLALLLFGLASLVGWTTLMADLAPALTRLLRPLRLLRVPVDEVVVTLALSVRCLPLLVEEMRTLHAARRMREPVVPSSWTGRVRYFHDVLVTALVSSLRRARELADAMEARGGPGAAVLTPLRLGWSDAAAFVVTAAAVAAMAML